MGDRVLVVGGGGREHALAWSLARSPELDEVLVAPGNAGTARTLGCRNVAIKATDIAGLVALARKEDVRLVVIGPEDPLVAGLADALTAVGIAAFGPSADAAQLEGSKAHCKAFLQKHGIPTGGATTFTDVESAQAHLSSLDSVPVVKASGLAAGKGVIVAETMAEAQAALVDMLDGGRFGAAGAEVLLEERLHGPELSVLAFSDGRDFVVMPAAQDHKRLLEGDAGPNTGGMGAFHPSSIATPELLTEISETVIAPTLAALAAEGRPYVGVLYAGIMLTDAGPKVIEYNCRFGDPETQVVLPLLATDLLEVCEACVEGRLGELAVRWHDAAAVAVVMAAAGYPSSSTTPEPISGLHDVDAMVFHAGTSDDDGTIMASGGRVLAVTALAPTLAEAAEIAHDGVGRIAFFGSQHRRDIGRATAEVRA